MRVDFAELRLLARNAARQAFTYVRLTQDGERFYAYVLYTDESVMTIVPAYSSEEALQRKLSEAGDTSPALAKLLSLEDRRMGL